MSASLEILKRELEHFGQANDAATTERAGQMLNITRDTGEFLSVLVRATRARAVLEIGTSNGYSTLWLAEALEATGGMVTTVELSEYKAGLATANFTRSGLGSIISLLRGDAGSVLDRCETSSFDFVFLDAERSAYARGWSQLRRILRPGGVLVADNAVSHAEEMAPFTAMVKADTLFKTSLVLVGKGELLAVKASV
jgi:predicted O-methyltransferase YrrM